MRAWVVRCEFPFDSHRQWGVVGWCGVVCLCVCARQRWCVALLLNSLNSFNSFTAKWTSPPIERLGADVNKVCVCVRVSLYVLCKWQGRGGQVKK